jgi:Xaa-Pro aminopeptidase
MKTMADPKERLMTSISTSELERRWKAVREVMKEEKLDYLIIRNDESFLGGNVKWFTDLPAQTNYPVTVIFPADDEMTLISHGAAAPAEPGPPPWAVRGVKKRLSSPYMPSAHYTNNYDAEMAVDVLQKGKKATIGLVGRAFIPVCFVEYLAKHLAGSEFLDVTDQIDRIKVIKSPEEVELIKQTAKLQDLAMEHVKKSIKPGLRDFEIAAEALYSTSRQGSNRHVLLVGSGPPGTPVRIIPHQFQNRVIQDGDQISVLIETNGPGGLWTELGRCLSIGEPSQELKDASDAALEAQKISLDMLKPGADPKDLWDANNAFLEKNGYFPENRLYAHGQGYDFVERPLIRYDEPMKIQTGMNITVHPAATNDTAWACFTDNYIVTDGGAGPCIHETPKEIIVI